MFWMYGRQAEVWILGRFDQIFWSKVPSMKNPMIDVVGEFSG